MARITACLALVAVQPYCAIAGFGSIKLPQVNIPPVKDIGEALKNSGAEAVEELKKHQSEIADQAVEALGDAGLEAKAKAEEVHEKMQDALANVTGATNGSLKDTTFGEMMGQGREYVDSALENAKVEGRETLEKFAETSKNIEGMTPSDAMKRLREATGSNATASPQTPAGLTGRPSDGVADGAQHARTSAGTTPEEAPEPVEGSSGPSDTVWVLLALLMLALGGWLAFRHLTKPRRVGQPMLMDSELGEGTPVSAGFMGGGSSARQLAPPQASGGSGFTRF